MGCACLNSQGTAFLLCLTIRDTSSGSMRTLLARRRNFVFDEG